MTKVTQKPQATRNCPHLLASMLLMGWQRYTCKLSCTSYAWLVVLQPEYLGYLKDDLERVQNRCLDIIGLPRNTIEPLAVRRENLTRKELKRIPDSETHPCRRFIPKAVVHKYNLRSRSNCHANFAVPTSHTDRHQRSFIPRAAKLAYN